MKKITALTVQKKNPDRINVILDGKYSFSLDIAQVSELKVKVGQEYSDEQLLSLRGEGEFSRVYARALEYCLMRPRSAREVRDYLHRKTRQTRTKNGELKAGISQTTVDRVFNRLLEKSYIDDEAFASYWLENRSQKKGASQRKLISELRSKGVSSDIIEKAISDVDRDEVLDLRKVIEKKKSRYQDQQKFIAYLLRQGFLYEDIKRELSRE